MKAGFEDNNFVFRADKTNGDPVGVIVGCGCLLLTLVMLGVIVPLVIALWRWAL